MKIEIVRATVVLSEGADQVCLWTELPAPFPPNVDKEPLSLNFKTTKDWGVEYVKKHFGIEPKVIDLRIPNTYIFGKK
jgi:hypothetical protein